MQLLCAGLFFFLSSRLSVCGVARVACFGHCQGNILSLFRVNVQPKNFRAADTTGVY